MNALYTHLSVLEASGLVALETVEPELSYAFRHALIQEIAYSSLTRADRKQLHQAIASSLESMYPSRLEELAPLLGEHFDKAGDQDRALHYYQAAACAAQRSYANPEAILYYRRGLKIVMYGHGHSDERVALLAELCQNLGRVLELSGQHADAQQHYDEMEAFARQEGYTALELGALVARITLHSTPTTSLDPDLARRLSHRALELARGLQDQPAEAKIYWNLLLANYFSNDIPAAQEHGERSLEVARRFNLREQLAYTLNDLGGYVYPSLGFLTSSLPMIEEARSIFQEQNNLPMLADNAANAAGVYFSMGNFLKALEKAAESFEIAKSIGNLWGQAYSQGVVGMIYAHQGMAEQALRNLDEAIQKGSGSGFMAALVICSSMKAYLLANFGLLDEAAEQARDAVSAGGQVANYWVDQAYGCLAWIYILQGRLDAAEEALGQSRLSERGFEAFFLTSMVMTAECEMRLARFDYAGLLAYTDSYLAIVRQNEANAFLPDGLYYQGSAFVGLERWDEARQAFAEADRAAASMGTLRVRWKVQAALAALEFAHGDRNVAILWLEEARGLIARVVAHAGSERLQAAFLQQPAVSHLQTMEV